MRQRNSMVAKVWVLGIFGALSWRLLHFIHRNAVNLLFMDQWDFYGGLFHSRGTWDLFRWQHGPHRMGLGLLIIRAVAAWSQWDARADAMAIGIVTVFSAGVALEIKRRLAGGLDYWDALIPMLFLTLRQWSIFLNVPDIAHGALPLLLVMVYGWCLLVANPHVKYAAVLAINFVAIHTGFGFFLGVVTPLVIAVELAVRIRERRSGIPWLWACFVIALVSLAFFFVGFQFHGTQSVRFARPQPVRYAAFVLLMLSKLFTLRSPNSAALLVGLVVAIGLALTLRGALRSLSSADLGPRLLLFTFVTFTIVFAVNCAVGRLHLGVAAGRIPRYVPSVIPGLFALYLAIRADRSEQRRQLCTWVFAVLLTVTEVIGLAQERPAIAAVLHNKTAWRACYLARHNIAACDDATGFRLHPNGEHTQLQWKLDYLEAHHLNLFKTP